MVSFGRVNQGLVVVKLESGGVDLRLATSSGCYQLLPEIELQTHCQVTIWFQG